MKRIRKYFQAIMNGQKKSPFCLLEVGLYLISLVYGGLVGLRAFCYEKKWAKSEKLPCGIISVGNITLGGTGKTPMTIYLAQKVRDLGYRVAVISRGYKGGAEKTGGVVSDGKNILMTPDLSGDEPFMMAGRLKDIPVIVGRNRYAGGQLAIEKFHASVIILDDGFQHLKLARDLNLVLLDSQNPLGNGYLFPRGILRESRHALIRADAVILTRFREESASQVSGINALISRKPIFRSGHIPYIQKIIESVQNSVDTSLRLSTIDVIRDLSGQCVYAFSGIAKNDDFKKTVEGLGCCLTGFKAFPDHHPYSRKDLHDIAMGCENLKARFILTTEKDGARIPEDFSWPVPLVIIGLNLGFRESEPSFDRFLEDYLRDVIVKGVDDN